MNYQKIKNQDDFSNSIVKEGDLLTFFSKDQNGKISLICKDSNGQFKEITSQKIYQLLNQINVNYQFTIENQNVFLFSVTKEELGITKEINLEVIDSQGYNITTDTRLSRRWNNGIYQLTMVGNWIPGTYTLRVF